MRNRKKRSMEIYIKRYVALILALVMFVETLPLSSIPAKAKLVDDWTTVDTNTGTAMTGTYGNGVYVLLNDNGELYTSCDVQNWNCAEQLRLSKEYISNLKLKFVNGYFYVYGAKGIVKSSQDGQTWTDVSVNNESVSEIVYGDGNYYAFTGWYDSTAFAPQMEETSGLYKSEDGVNWTCVQSELEVSGISSGVFADGKIALMNVIEGKIQVIDTQGTILHSEIIRDNSGADLFSAISYVNGSFVAFYDNRIYVSKDTLHWDMYYLKNSRSFIQQRQFCEIQNHMFFLADEYNVVYELEVSENGEINWDIHENDTNIYNSMYCLVSDGNRLIGYGSNHIYLRDLYKGISLADKLTPTMSGNNTDNEEENSGILESENEISLTKDVVVEADFELSNKTLFLNGHTMMISGDFHAYNGAVSTLGGNLCVKGNMLVSGVLVVDGDISVSGDLTIEKGVIEFKEASVHVEGNCSVLRKEGNYGLQMTHTTDELIVHKDFIYEATMLDTNHHGMISIYGDAEFGENFRTTDEHTVRLCGDKMQRLTMGIESYIANLSLHNTSSDGVVYTSVLRYGTLDTNHTPLAFGDNATKGITGYTLTEDTVVDGDMIIAAGDMDLNGYSLSVNGTYCQLSGKTVINGGKLFVQNNLEFKNPDLAQSYSSDADSLLVMTSPEDYVCVQGDLYYNSIRSTKGYLTDGVLEVRGSFSNEGEGFFITTKEHLTYFNPSGDGSYKLAFNYADEQTLLENVKFNADFKDYYFDGYYNGYCRDYLACFKNRTYIGDTQPPDYVISNVQKTTGKHVYIYMYEPSDNTEIRGFSIYKDGQLIADEEECRANSVEQYKGMYIYKVDEETAKEKGNYYVVAHDAAGLISDKWYSFEAQAKMPELVSVTPQEHTNIGQTVTFWVTAKSIDDYANDNYVTISYLDPVTGKKIELSKSQIQSWPGQSYASERTKHFTWSLPEYTQDYDVPVIFEYEDTDGAVSSYTYTYHIDRTPPTEPKELSLTINRWKVELAWSESISDDISEYSIYRRAQNEDEFTCIKSFKSGDKLFYRDYDTQLGTSYEYFIATKDDLGNESKSMVPKTIKVPADEEPPVITTYSFGEQRQNGTITFKAEATDNHRIDTYAIYIRSKDGMNQEKLVNRYNSSSLTGTSTTFNSNLYDDGEYVLTAYAYDESGNKSEAATSEIIFDNTPPVTPILTYGNLTSTTVKLSWNRPEDEDFKRFILQRYNGSTWNTVTLSQEQQQQIIDVKSLMPERTYKYRVCALDDLGNRSAYSEISFETPPDTQPPFAVRGLKVGKRTASRVYLTWAETTDNVGVMSYRLYRNGELLCDNLQTLYYEDVEVEAEQEYEYSITATDAAGNESKENDVIKVKTSLPIIRSVSPKEGGWISTKSQDITIQAKNDPLAGTRELELLYYNTLTQVWETIYAGELESVNTTAVVVSKTISWDTSAVLVTDNIDMRIRLTDCDNNSSEKDFVYHLKDLIPPTKPQLSVRRRSGSSITISYIGADDNVAVTGYNIYRNGEKIAENIQTNEYKDEGSGLEKGLEEHVPYRYTVTALDEAGNESEMSNEIEGAVCMPKITAVTPEEYSVIGGEQIEFSVVYKDSGNSLGNKVYVSWYDETNACYQAINSDGASQKKHMNGTLQSVCNWTIPNVTGNANVPADIKIVLVDEDGNKDEKTMTLMIDCTPPKPPATVTAKDFGGNILITWQKSRSSDCVGYIIYRKNETGTWDEIATTQGYENLSYIDKNVVKNQAYTYGIRAYDAFDQKGEFSESVSATAGTDTVSPVVLQLSPEQPLISSQASFCVEAEDNYKINYIKIYIQKEGGQKALLRTIESDAATAKHEFKIDTTEFEDGSYVLYAAAVDEEGNISSEYKRYYNIDNTGIEKVQMKECKATSTAVQLFWEDVTAEDFAYFSVEQKEGEEFQQIDKVENVLSYVKSGLAPNTDYVFRVTAYDKAGNRGVASDEITITTTEDEICPKLTRVGPAQGAYANLIPLTMSASDNAQVKTTRFLWSLDGENYELLSESIFETKQTSVSDSHNWDISQIAEGNVYVKFEAYDGVGNRNALSTDGDIVACYRIDRTAPAQVTGLVADGGEGEVTLSWDETESADERITYRIYRAKEDGVFCVHENGCTTAAYTDMDVMPNQSYMYYITAVDEAGNESVQSVSIQAKCQPDRQKPQITGVSHDNDAYLSAHSNIEVLGIDNSRMDKIRMEYRKAGGDGIYTRVESSQSEGRACYASFTLPREDLEEGCTYEFRFWAIDKAGNASEVVKRKYYFDLTSPKKPELTATSESFEVALSWTENTEEDFECYKIYRRRYNTSKEECLATTISNTYKDRTAEPDCIYYYRVEAYDALGNVSKSKEKYSYANTIDSVAPVAVLPEFQMQQYGSYVEFDASGSYDNVRITSYVWDFGDGSYGSGAKIKHLYEQAGEYDVQLTVYDAMGNKATAAAIVTVIPTEGESDCSKMTIRVTDTEGSPIQGCHIYVKELEKQDTINLYTGSVGEAIYVGKCSYYHVAAYAEGYLPKESVEVLDSEEGIEVTYVLEKGDVAVGEIKCRRMGLAELMESGVDLSDPANYHQFECKVTLIYKKYPLPVPLNIPLYQRASRYEKGYEGKGRASSNQGGTAPQAITEVEVYQTEEQTVVTAMTVTTGVSWLKEMYSVDLSVTNCASGSFTIENSTAVLNVPDGMAFVPSKYAKDVQQNIDTIYAGQTKTLSWVLRGEKTGSYPISAQYSGRLMPFEDDIYATFEAEAEVDVKTGEGLHIYVRPESAYYIGQDYYIYGTLKNESGRTFYNVNFRLGNARMGYDNSGKKPENSKEPKYEDGTIEISTSMEGSSETGANGEKHSVSGNTLCAKGGVRKNKNDGVTNSSAIREESKGEIQDPWKRSVVNIRYVDSFEHSMETVPTSPPQVSGNDTGEQTEIVVSNQVEGEENQVFVSALYPGQGLNILYKCRPGFSGDPETEYYRLVDHFVRMVEGENLGVKVSVEPASGSHVPMQYRYNWKASLEDSFYGDPVSVVSGAFEQDIATLSVGNADKLSVDLHYNSRYANKLGEAGYGITHTYEQYILNYGSWVVLRNGKGDEKKFIPEGSVSENGITYYKPATTDMDGLSLERTKDGYVLSMETGNRFEFDKYGFLTGTTGPEGRHMTVAWDGNDMLLTEDLSGEKICMSYDENGLLTKISDDHDREVKLEYSNGTLVSVTDVLGNQTRFSYNKKHHMTKIVNALGETVVENTYDEYGRVITQTEPERGMPSVFTYHTDEENHTTVTVTDHLGNVTVTESDTKGNIIRSVDGNGNETVSTYENHDKLISIVEADGAKTTYTYTEKGDMQTMTASDGTVVTYSYDEKRNMTGMTFADGTSGSYVYGSRDELIKTVSPSGAIRETTYDENGQIAAEEQVGIGKVSYTYDKGRLVSVTDAEGGITHLSYDEYGNVNQRTDAEGNVTGYTYDRAGNLLKEITPGGKLTEYTYDAAGRVTAQTESELGQTPRTKTFTYDSAGRLVKETDAAGRQTSYTYDNEDRLVKITYPDASTKQSVYDGAGNLVREIAPNGLVTTYESDVRGNITKLTVGEKVYTYELYPNGNIKKETAPDGGVTTYSYDEVFNCTAVTDPLGNRHETAYDAMGNVISQKDALGNEIKYTYNPSGMLLSQTDANGNTTSYTYDGNGNITEIKDAMGNKTVMQYDKNSRMTKLTKTVSQKELSQLFAYDADGNLIKTTDAKGNTQKLAYDAYGQIQRSVGKDGKLTQDNTYDEAGRVTESTDASGIVTGYTYDIEDRVKELTQALGTESAVTTSYVYDTDGNLTQTTDANNGSARATYDIYGRMTKNTDPLGNETIYLYDRMDRCIREINALGKMQEFTYDNNGNLIQTTDCAGVATTYTYDKANRLIKEKKGELETAYEYDANGNLLKVTENGQTIERTYDALNRVTQVTDYQGNTIAYAYDELGNRISITYPGGKAVRYTWDECQYLSSVTDVDGNITKYTYDEEGRLLTTTRPDASTESRTYDEAGRLSRINDTAADGKTLQSLTYTYDERGNIASIHDASETQPPVPEQTQDMTCTYGADNRLATWNGKTVTYDANGNMTTGPVDNRMAQLSYDVYNRLVKVKADDGSITEYTYDAENIRMKATYTDPDGNTSQETYITDSEATYSQLLICERDGEQTTYSYADGLTSATTKGETSYYHYNHLGSTTMLTDENGDVTARAVYGTYGELLGIYDGSGSDITTTEYSKKELTDKCELTLVSGALKFLYNAQFGVQTDENSLYYMRARYYSQDIKRFVNMDTIKGQLTNTQSLNRYIYVQGNPVSATDPLGLCPNYGTIDTKYGNALLTALSFVPVVGGLVDLYDAKKYADSGNTKMALFMLGCMAAGSFGDLAKGSRLLAKGSKYASKTDNVTDVLQAGTKGGKRLSDIFAGMSKSFSKFGDNLRLTGAKTLDAIKSSKFVKTVQNTTKSIARSMPDKIKTAAIKGGKAASAAVRKGDDVVAAAACFVAGTQIKTITGSKNIEQIKAGDYVYAKNPESGETGWKRVAHVFVREIDLLIHVKVGDELIETTATHPFWVDGYGFKYAENLVAGDYVESADGKLLRVESVEKVYPDEIVTVYNFEVEDWHTYYVSEEEILVHNMCMMPKGGSKTKTLYHYTNEMGMNGIVDSQKLNPSLKANNPKDCFYGEGQYLSDIVPGTKTPAQLSRNFINNPFQGNKYSYYVEIDVTDLEVTFGRDDVFVILNQEPLDLTNRIISFGKVGD